MAFAALTLATTSAMTPCPSGCPLLPARLPLGFWSPCVLRPCALRVLASNIGSPLAIACVCCASRRRRLYEARVFTAGLLAHFRLQGDYVFMGSSLLFAYDAALGDAAPLRVSMIDFGHAHAMAEMRAEAAAEGRDEEFEACGGGSSGRADVKEVPARVERGPGCRVAISGASFFSHLACVCGSRVAASLQDPFVLRTTSLWCRGSPVEDCLGPPRAGGPILGAS